MECASGASSDHQARSVGRDEMILLAGEDHLCVLGESLGSWRLTPLSLRYQERSKGNSISMAEIMFYLWRTIRLRES